MLLLLTTPLLMNYQRQKPMLMGAESYYHLVQPQGWKNALYVPLHVLQTFLPGDAFAFVPVLFALTSLLCFYVLSKDQWRLETSLLFVIFLIISPAFIYNHTILGTASFTLALLLLSLFLGSRPSGRWRWLALIPLLFLFNIDFATLILALLVLVSFTGLYQWEKLRQSKWALAVAVLAALSLLYGLLRGQPFSLGPFHHPNLIADLISDFGGQSGVSLFILPLALLGLWKSLSRKWIPWYLLLVYALFLYWYNPETILFLSIILIYFAALGFLYLRNRRWALHMVRNFTLLLFLLGLLFSTLTYVHRLPLSQPTHGDVLALHWLQENTESTAIIFSDPGNAYYIRYFARRNPYYEIHLRNPGQEKTTVAILNSTYVSQLFPALDSGGISTLYITPQMKRQLPQDYGLLFLLQNERFKLAHNTELIDIWFYQQENEGNIKRD